MLYPDLKEEETYMVDELAGSRPEPKLFIPNKLLRSVSYLDWIGTAECKVWSYLVSYIIRAPMEEGSYGNFVHDYYYVKGLLVSRWNQKQMAQNMGKSRNSAGQISRLTTKMANKGFLRKEYSPWNGTKTLFYIMGTHDMSSQKHETIFALEELWKQEIERKRKKKDENPEEVFDRLDVKP